MREFTDIEKQILHEGFTREFWKLLSEVLESWIEQEKESQLAAMEIDRINYHRARREGIEKVVRIQEAL